MPRLQYLYDTYGSRGYVPLGVNLWEDMQTVVKVYAQTYSYPIFRCPSGGQAWSVYNISNSIPVNYIIDQQNMVEYAGVGWDEATIVAYLDALTGVGEGKTAPAVKVLGASPSPTSGPVTIRFSLAKPGAASLRVFDHAGKVVRTLGVNGTTGVNAAFWNLRDDAGNAVANGLYVYELRQGNACQRAKLAVIR